MQKEIIVIGGGIIGLCSAYYLKKEGHHVTVVDQSNLDAGASYVNAGYLSPSHIIPLSAPGVMKKGIKWMFNSSSPLYIKPRLDSDFIKWTWAFNKSCNSNHVKKSAPVIRDISVLSQKIYEEIKTSEQFTSQYEKKGLLMLCQTQKMLDEELEMAKMAVELGLDAKEVNPTEIKELEPNVDINAIGAIYYKCDHHSTPHEFMNDMKSYLKNAGVNFYPNEKVIDITVSDQSITSVQTDKQTLVADEFVLAAGSWSALLSKKLELNLLLQAGKGYRINTSQSNGITLPAILAEAKTAVTPMNGFTRFAGTMEIAGINHKINKNRVEAIANAASRYFPNIKISEEEKADAACGLRPVSPDGLPYIGKSSKCKNLTIAAGHAMMGWSMGTATGLLVSEIISEKKTSLDLNPFHPDRKF
ncbi:FAD-dependent oxidoreductase [Winogradskyella echinorum]|uniref:FAD-dependent oxidoreductase n=1 Tax=Winogradskyella echinorum TaxID=538189 RepID=A0ABR6XXP2_9FLAO|nr:FAD-dependent oxidoreductase [Winogradskyella echinorum]MBC3845273.1 FAD-dependent oxidoreductase [Winogradskyella echinorum]MBC5749621.1 FAD-dependent oxidoreductase [Winogradskyella echinorum]